MDHCNRPSSLMGQILEEMCSESMWQRTEGRMVEVEEEGDTMSREDEDKAVVAEEEANTMTADKDSLKSNEATEVATTMTTVVTATTEEEATKTTEEEEEEEEEDITREDLTAIVGEETLVTTGTETVLLRLLWKN
jgi:hypothetical protein